MNSHFAAET